MATGTPLFNPNDGLTGRDGGPYLDQVEMQQAEERRAKVEEREPDYDNLQPTAGVPLVTAATLASTYNSTAIPSQSGRDPMAEVVNAVADNPDVGPTPLATSPSTEEIEEVGEENPATEPQTSGSPATQVFLSPEEIQEQQEQPNETPETESTVDQEAAETDTTKAEPEPSEQPTTASPDETTPETNEPAPETATPNVPPGPSETDPNKAV
jgi:hypothetical protein